MIPDVSIHVSRPANRRSLSIVNALVAAMLVLALGFGAWQTAQRFGGGGSGDGGSDDAQLGLLTQPDASATPLVFSAYDPPTAEDCTVEPMTVDEVLEIVDIYGNPSRLFEEIEGEGDFPVPDYAVTEEGGGNGPPSQMTLEAIQAVHSEWMACHMAGSQFQMWALSTAKLVYRDVTEWLYPVYLTREEGRVYLEQLRDTGTSNGRSGTDRYQPVYIDHDPRNSNQPYSGYVELGWVRYDESGIMARKHSASYEAQLERCALSDSGMGFYVYQWNVFDGTWEMSNPEAGAGG